MTRDTIKWEEELREAGWTAVAKHPMSPLWKSPDGVLYPGPGYAHEVMSQRKEHAKEEQPTNRIGHQVRGSTDDCSPSAKP